ncbi:hypothetical protein ACN6LC_006206 [Streptomyces violaceoruber]|uniref:hypothetical protein n=1 Tax=Streptomyces violaceoruber TaxID=1935 RepID=UPI00403C86BD
MIQSSDDPAVMDDLEDVRRAAPKAGRRLGWKPATRLVGERLFVLDEREVPEEIQQFTENAAAEAMDRAWREHR